MPILSSEVETHRTFMDTLGRTTLKLTALNVVDEFRDREVTVSLPVLEGFDEILMTSPGRVRLLILCWIQKAYRDLHLSARSVWYLVADQTDGCQHRQKSVDFLFQNHIYTSI